MKKMNERFKTSEILLRGIVILLPEELEIALESIIVDGVADNSQTALKSADGNENQAYRVIYYGRYVVYITQEPEKVPGYTDSDYARLANAKHRIQKKESKPNNQNGLAKFLTPNRGYIVVPSGLVDSLLDPKQGTNMIADAVDSLAEM